MKRKSTLTVITIAMSLSMASTSFAGEWQWIDGNSDGIAECYYMENGTALTNATTPDGYQVNETGAWIVDGVVQTQGTGQSTNGVNHSANYDPAHPLATMVDKWNLRITPEANNLNYKYLANENIHAMLTNQMEYYTDWYDMPWSKGYEEENKAEEYAIYKWFCDWLNGMDFEHMTEMERAKEIQKVVGPIRYRRLTDEVLQGKSHLYYTLMNKEGQCYDYALVACELSRALGLKSTTSGGGDHMVYFVQVDGEAYYGSNGFFELDAPYSGMAQDERTRFSVHFDQFKYQV